MDGGLKARERDTANGASAAGPLRRALSHRDELHADRYRLAAAVQAGPLAASTMRHNEQMRTRRIAFAVGTAVAVGAGAWALRMFVPSDEAPSHTKVLDPAMTSSGDSTRAAATDLPLPASAPAPMRAGDRFKLVGVVASGVAAGGGDGVALIAVDGRPARAFHVGATVEGDIVVREVTARGATLGPRGGGEAIALDVVIAPAPAAATAPEPAAELRLVTKHPPLPPQTPAASKPPGDGAPRSGDDGRWRPPGAQ